MVRLQDLSIERRRNYLWHRTGFLDLYEPGGEHPAARILRGEWALGTEFEGRRCQVGRGYRTRAEHAVRIRPTKTYRDLPDDHPLFNTWHVAGGEEVLCCPYWAGGNRARIISAPVDLMSVAPADRCRWARGDWPPCLLPWGYARSDGKKRVPLLLQLVHEFGGMCVLCHRSWATSIDHDHLTGMVRGLLCTWCNTWVDGCPHPRDCAYAEYLNEPPARQLGLVYPVVRRKVQAPSYQRRMLLFREVAELMQCGSIPPVLAGEE